MNRLLSLIILVLTPVFATGQIWTAKLDKDVLFYQTTDLGVVLAATEKSLYAIDGSSGETLWRRKDITVDQNDVAPIPGTDLILLSLEKSNKSRIEAVDLLSGSPIWRSEKLTGAIMQTAVDFQQNLLAVVMVKDAKNRARDGYKQRPILHVLDLSSGRELWKYDMSEVEMMTTSWPENKDKEVSYCLDNYYPPVFVDGRLFTFYEGVTSFDGQAGKERLREKYKVNEEGLALTEAQPVFSSEFIYVSGRGRVRAISRDNGDTRWEAKDLGLTPEMILVNDVLVVRTGGQFTRLENGETVERGPYGVSALDARSGKVLWRYKSADKGITNLVIADQNTIVAADNDEVFYLDFRTGKRLRRQKHKIEKAAYALVNENSQVVIGGRSEIVAFDLFGNESWRVQRNPPGRGWLRTVSAIAARAASLYFRFGGTANTVFSGLRIANTAMGFSWSGLSLRSSVSNLQALATSASRGSGTSRFSNFGIASGPRGSNSRNLGGAGRSRVSDIEDRLMDRLDPTKQLERLSRYLWHRDQLATLRGNWMYFYTDLKTKDGDGLAGVNINNGRVDREVRIGTLDERFISDEILGVIFSASGNKLQSYSVR
ncbi:MAG TPA: PQQ-binding-like beta-propeller repeat protein [Pyrinomonadaceae bacterium]|nr:PQQ-binding-like beta-propeller repeat protein [Pyrinomonadaceae bacterium]